MSDVTHILSAIEQGDPRTAEDLLPLAYDELRKLAAQKLSQERPGQTLQATALVHEAYLRLVDAHRDFDWHSRGHFFAAAAEAMRRILIERAQRKASVKHGGNHHRRTIDEAQLAIDDDALQCRVRQRHSCVFADADRQLRGCGDDRSNKAHRPENAGRGAA